MVMQGKKDIMAKRTLERLEAGVRLAAAEPACPLVSVFAFVLFVEEAKKEANGGEPEPEPIMPEKMLPVEEPQVPFGAAGRVGCGHAQNVCVYRTYRHSRRDHRLRPLGRGDGG